MFTKANQSLLVDNVADQIEQAIVAGQLQPGDRLPPTDRLEESFGASRGTLREAFRVLRQKGLLTAKSGAGGGLFVTEPSHDPIKDGLALLIRTRSLPLEHLADFREGLEGCAAELAAGRVTEADIQNLRQMLDRLTEAARGGLDGWENFHRLEADLHRALVALSGNPLYELNVTTVHDNIGAYFGHYLPKSEQVLSQNCRDWAEIISALEQSDGPVAGRLIKEHIRRFNRNMAAARNGASGRGDER